MSFNYLSRRGGNKRGGGMVQGQVFLKKKGGWQFCYLIFSKFIIFTFRNYFTLCKVVNRDNTFEEIFFSTNIILWRKFILSCLKKNLCMCKEGWRVGLGQDGGSLREIGRIVWNILKRSWNRREGSGNKKFGASWVKGWVL